MTPGAEIEPGPHWWKASALTTRLTLPPLLQTIYLKLGETIAHESETYTFGWRPSPQQSLSLKKLCIISTRYYPGQRA